MKTNIILKSIAAAAFCIAVLGGCTANFEDWNTNKHEATAEQMEQDNLFTGALFAQMERSVIFYAGAFKNGDSDILDSDYQIAYNLLSEIYGGYFAPTNSFDSNGNHTGAYNMTSKPGWIRAMFAYKYNGTMSAYSTFMEKAEELGQDAVIAMGNIVKVFSMHQVTDYYGPIPYTKYGQSINAEYDSQETVYKAMLAELDEAIEALEAFANAGNTTILEGYDYIYDGNVVSWIKLANSLRLRLAMRIVYADATLAKTEAEKSVADSYGVLTASGDAASLSHTMLTYHHPIWEITNNFNDGDTHMNASMDVYLNGYADPRRAVYWQAANDGGYHGVRLGVITSTWDAYGNAANNVSKANIGSSTPITWMTASEVYFLRSEGALRGWNMGGTAKALYEEGIKVSFEEAGVSGADAYIANATATPAAFVDKAGTSSTAALSSVTIAWDESASDEVKLEKIITQKWIAMFPNGCEAWAEFRRTGYPKLLPVVTNNSGGAISTDTQIRRIPFPDTEYDTNAGEVAKAVSLLGGSDNGGTKLWWDKK